MPEEFPESWVNDWLQKGYRPKQTACYTYQNVEGDDVIRKNKFLLMDIATGKPSGEKTYLIQHRLLQAVVLGADSWRSGLGREGWEKDLWYRRVQLESAIASGDDIFLCEGEKDADAVASAWGVSATSHHQGAAGATEAQLKVISRTSGYIYIVADKDPTGYQIAWHHSQVLMSLGVEDKSIIVLEPRVSEAKADMSDHIAAGMGIGETRLIRPKELAALIEEHGTLSTRTARRWGYGYGEEVGEWVTQRA